MPIAISKLLRVDAAIIRATGIKSPEDRQVVLQVLDAVQRFYREQPSQLMGEFDLEFLAEVLIDRIALIRPNLGQPWLGWWDEGEYPAAYPLKSVGDDRSEGGIRERQAGNFIAALDFDRPIQAVLLIIQTWALAKQSPAGRNPDGSAVCVSRPQGEFDFLFMAMAVYYALRPGQGPRLLLEGRIDR